MCVLFLRNCSLAAHVVFASCFLRLCGSARLCWTLCCGFECDLLLSLFRGGSLVFLCLCISFSVVFGFCIGLFSGLYLVVFGGSGPFCLWCLFEVMSALAGLFRVECVMCIVGVLSSFLSLVSDLVVL